MFSLLKQICIYFLIVSALCLTGCPKQFRMQNCSLILNECETAALVHQSQARFLAHDELGALLTSIKSGKRAREQGTPTGDRLTKFKGLANGLWSFDINPEGTILATGNTTPEIALWHVNNGRLIKRLEGPSIMACHLEFSADGKILAAMDCKVEKKTVQIWDVDTMKLLGTFTEESREDDFFKGFVVHFSSDGKILLSGTDNVRAKLIRLWNGLTGKLINTFKGHLHPVFGVEVSPDGKVLATGSWGKTIKLWDIENGKEIATLRGHSKHVYVVNFSPDGKTLISFSDDGTTRIWNLDLEDLLVRGCEWLHSYLENNPNVSEEDRRLCDDILITKDTDGH